MSVFIDDKLLPELLTDLIAQGKWTSAIAKSTFPLAFPGIDAAMPLMYSLDMIRREHEGWKRVMRETPEYYTFPSDIDPITPATVVTIADFEPEVPIVLNYFRDPQEPAVAHLVKGGPGEERWVETASSFKQFAKMLGLIAE
jgi:hypothetical protein